MYAEGGIPRFYRGLGPGLIQARQLRKRPDKPRNASMFIDFHPFFIGFPLILMIFSMIFTEFPVVRRR